MEYNGQKLKTQNITYRKLSIGNRESEMMVKNYDGNYISLAKSLQSFLTYSFFLHYTIDDVDIYWSNRVLKNS